MKKVLFFVILLLLVVVALAGCVNENTSAYTAEQTIREIKKQQNTKAEIICTNTAVLQEKPYESIEYTLYDVTNDIEFTATASINPRFFIPFIYIPIHRELTDNYFSSYIKKQNATLEPFAKEHGLLMPYSNVILVSSQEELPYAAELFAKMMELYDFDTFKVDGKWHDIEIAYCAEGAESKTKQVLSYFYIMPKTNRIYLDAQEIDSEYADYYSLENNTYHQGNPSKDTAISLEAWVYWWIYFEDAE